MNRLRSAAYDVQGDLTSLTLNMTKSELRIVLSKDYPFLARKRLDLFLRDAVRGKLRKDAGND